MLKQSSRALPVPGVVKLWAMASLAAKGLFAAWIQAELAEGSLLYRSEANRPDTRCKMRMSNRQNMRLRQRTSRHRKATKFSNVPPNPL